MEEAMMDIVGDENDELVRKQRMMRWDKSKRKYVQTTVGEELSGESKSKKTRLENGTLAKNHKTTPHISVGDLIIRFSQNNV